MAGTAENFAGIRHPLKGVWNTDLYYATYRTGRTAIIRYNSIITTINDLYKLAIIYDSAKF